MQDKMNRSRSGVPSVHFILWLLVLACFTSPLAAAPLRIYIVTDLEGASGVYKFTQTREPDHPLGEKAKEYLMGDIAAVVRGLRAADVAAIEHCKPYKLSLPIRAKKEHLVFAGPSAKGRRVTKEGTIEDVLKLLKF